MPESELAAEKNTAKKSASLEKAAKMAKAAAEAADAGKAGDLLVLQLSEITVLCDYFVICTGNSAPHLRAISERVCDEIRSSFSVKPSSIEGDPASRWIVIDFGSVIVHVLSPEMRDFYRLENMWGDAPRILDFLPLSRRKKN